MTLTVDDRELIEAICAEANGWAMSRPNRSHKLRAAAARFQSLREAMLDIAQFEPDEAAETPPYTQIAAFAKHRARAALTQTEVP